MTDAQRPQMPQDGRSEAIPVLGYKKAGYQTVTSNTDGTARSTELTSSVVTITVDQPVHIAQGRNDTVTALATDAKLPIGTHDVSTFKNGVHYPYIACRTFGATAAIVDIVERE